MGKPPTGPETAPPAESPLKKEFRRLARLSQFLRLGERTTISSSVIAGENDRTTMQRVTRYEDFLPLANAEQEARSGNSCIILQRYYCVMVLFY